MTTHTNAYQLAKWVANQLPHHPGASTRGLYQAYLPQFAEFGTDGTSGSAMIGTHLRDLLKEGLVIREKGAKTGNPDKWFWHGPAPAAEDSATIKESLTVAPPLTEPPLTESEARTIAAVFDAMGSRMGPPAAPREDSPPEQMPLDLGDPWDSLARSFAQACREESARAYRVDDLNTKLETLQRLADIVAPNISSVLAEIAHDLTLIGG
jgi:hypothetical protein